MPFPPFLLKYALPVVTGALVIVAFNVWLAGVKHDVRQDERAKVIAELAIKTEELKAEHAREAAELRERLVKREQQYASDIADITQRAMAGASSDSVSINSATVRLLNTRTARANSDIKEASGGADVPLSRIAVPRE